MAITNANASLEEAPLSDENARMTNSGIIPGLPVQLAGAKTKGGLEAVKAQPGVLMDEKSQSTVLQNMQRLADEIENPWRKFNEGLKDVNAWTMYNKAPAFALREEAANNDRSTLYNIRQQQAALQNSQALAKNSARVLGLPGYGETTSAQGAPAQGAPGVSQSPQLATYQRMINQLPLDKRPIAEMYIANGNIGEFTKLVEENYNKKPDAQKMLEWGETQPLAKKDAIIGQYLEKGISPRTEVINGRSYLYSSPAGREGAMGAAAEPVQGGLPTGKLSPVATEYVESRGRPGAVSPTGAEGVMQVLPSTQRNPGFGVTPARDNSPTELKRVGVDYLNALKKHYGDETFGTMAYQMGPGAFDSWLKTTGGDFNKLKPETKNYIGQVHLANSLLNRGDQNIVTSRMGNQQPGGNVGAMPSGNRVSVEDIKSEEANKALLNKQQVEGPIAELGKRIEANRDVYELSKRALSRLDEVKFGPGSGIKLDYIKGKMAVNAPVTAAEEKFYEAAMDLENVKGSKVALGAKAAMGAQYTQKESENFAKLFAGITDKNQYGKMIYQLDKTRHEIDIAHQQFLTDYIEAGGSPSRAEKEWQNSGVSPRMLKENVDVFKNMDKKETAAKIEKPKAQDPDSQAREWLAKNPNDPQAATVKKLLGIK